MFKLLTEAERQKVEHEYVRRRAIVMLFVLILILVAGIIGLLPSHVLSNARRNEVLERARVMGSVVPNDDEADLQTWLAETNRKLRVLSPTLDTDRPSNFIEKVLDQKMAGLAITGFSWIRAKEKVILLVNGIASDRQALIDFENRINSSGSFSEVTLPISNLAKNKDINFQIKFSLASSSPSVQRP